MALVSVTRLRLRSLRFLPQFMVYAIRSARQAAAAPGALGVQTRKTRGLTFWTLTAWSDESAMRQYIRAGTHGQAMAKLGGWCDEAAYTHWIQTEDTLPDWALAAEQLQRQGRLSRVKHPSVAQQQGLINVQ